jgi:hypothetical protein
MKLLTFVRGCWQSQVTDKATQAVWAEIFKGVSYEAAKQAVAYLARIGADRPSAGQIYKLAAQNDEIAAERARASRRLLPEPAPSPEEIERNKQRLREIIDNFSSKVVL